MIITTAMQNALNTGKAHIEWLVWIEAKNRNTGAVEAAGVHTGLDPINITIGAQPRLYQGVGHLVEIPAFTFKQGLQIEQETLTLSILSPEITNQIRAYNSDLAPTEIHLAVFDSDMTLAGVSTVLKGFINNIAINEGPNDATCSIGVTTNVAEATRGLTLTKSHASQKLIDPTDEGMKYASVAGTTNLQWGVDDGGYQNRGFQFRGSKRDFYNRLTG